MLEPQDDAVTRVSSRKFSLGGKLWASKVSLEIFLLKPHPL